MVVTWEYFESAGVRIGLVKCDAAPVGNALPGHVRIVTETEARAIATRIGAEFWPVPYTRALMVLR